MASPAAPSSSSCGRLSPTPRSTASPTRSRAPTCAPTKYDLGGPIPRRFSRKTEGLKGTPLASGRIRDVVEALVLPSETSGGEVRERPDHGGGALEVQADQR